MATRTIGDSRLRQSVGSADGVYFLGTPAWLGADRLALLRDEARTMRPGAESIRAQFFGDIGSVARELCESTELTEWVSTTAAPAFWSGFANFRYYDVPKSHVFPHLDTDHFALNVIVMLEHDHRDERRSALLLFAHGPDPLVLFLNPGEVILFDARAVVHARSPISDDGFEWACNLGIGFTPTVDLPNPGYWHPVDGWEQL